MLRIRPLAAIVAALLVLGLMPAAAAAVASNDAFSSATVITALPYGDTFDLAETTTEVDEPGCLYGQGTVWYGYTATADGIIETTLEGEGIYDTALNIYTASGPAFSDLTLLTCATFSTHTTLSLTAGTTYYFQATRVWDAGGIMSFGLAVVPPPANDNFADAAAITSLPFEEDADIRAATAEPGEPGNASTPSVWYRLDPESSTTVHAWASAMGPAQITAFQGGSLESLDTLATSNSGAGIQFGVEAGQTYYLRLMPAWGPPWQGSAHIQVVEAYAPTAYFWCDPVDPSTYDTIQFSNAVNDQFDVGVAAWFWDFGDGTSDTAQFPSHRFTQDGDYTVSLTITATDGRTTTSSQVVSVSTHNIAVVAFHAPRTAQVGKAKTFTIRVRNAVQPELATVALWRSVPGGWAWVASTTQEIPVSRGGSTSTYTFSYTFTQEDLSTGSVAFKAAVSLEGARDAIPGDNELTSPPTRILK